MEQCESDIVIVYKEYCLSIVGIAYTKNGVSYIDKEIFNADQLEFVEDDKIIEIMEKVKNYDEKQYVLKSSNVQITFDDLISINEEEGE